MHTAAAPQKEQVKTLGELFIRRGLFAKAERTHKRPHPGRKRLVKWPRQLSPIVKDQVWLASPAVRSAT